MSADELLDVIDVDDNVIGTSPKDICHRDNLLHRVVHFTLIDSMTKKILIVKQPASKNSDIGMLVFLGGHVVSGEDYEECLKREVKEELGVECNGYIEIGKHLFEYEGRSELAHFYLILWQGQQLTCDYEEMDEISWVGVSELVELRNNIGQITGYWVDNIDWNGIVDARPLD